MEYEGTRKRGEIEGQQHVVYRLLVEAAKVGPIIGKEGSNIRSLRSETKARIKISSPANRGDDRVITVSTRDLQTAGETNAAEAAFLKIYPQAIVLDAEDDTMGSLRLLIAASQAGAVIGRGGSTIKSIREESGANVRLDSHQDHSTIIAAEGDRACHISGKLSAIDTAVVSIMSILNNNPATEALEELESDGGGAGGGLQHQHYQQGGAAAALAAQQAAVFLAATGQMQNPFGYVGMPLFGGAAAFDDNYKRRRVQDSNAQAFAPMAASGSAEAPTTPPVASAIAGQQVLKSDMRVPSLAVGAILGRGGTTINNIRQLSGATIKVGNGERGDAERLVEISGTSAQIASAQSLISACVVQGSTNV